MIREKEKNYNRRKMIKRNKNLTAYNKVLN